jgi:hypothetical protein
MMNERIQELAEESGMTQYVAANNKYLERFAELMVKECAEYVQFYYKDHMCEVIAHDMKHHFGVE